MILRAITLMIMATPAMAQETEMPDFDAAILEACLAEHAGKEPETCIAVAAEACMEGENGSSTVGMSHCMGQELDIWDQRLNDAYKELMAEAKKTDEGYADEASSPHRAELLKDMQQSWIAFRDSSCAYAQSEFHGGSMAGTVGTQCLLDLTGKQALVLERQRDANDNR